MKAIHVSSAILLMLCVTAFSCGKRTDKAGKGGAATLKASPKHHSAYIYDCTIYLKYDSSVPPSDSNLGYDEQAVVTIEDGKPVATFTELKNGKYYIYGYGYDTAIAQNVKGGIPFEITDQGVTAVNVPVTEGD